MYKSMWILFCFVSFFLPQLSQNSKAEEYKLSGNCVATSNGHQRTCTLNMTLDRLDISPLSTFARVRPAGGSQPWEMHCSPLLFLARGFMDQSCVSTNSLLLLRASPTPPLRPVGLTRERLLYLKVIINPTEAAMLRKTPQWSLKPRRNRLCESADFNSLQRLGRLWEPGNG